jgi:Bacterial toxin 46
MGPIRSIAFAGREPSRAVAARFSNLARTGVAERVKIPGEGKVLYTSTSRWDAMKTAIKFYKQTTDWDSAKRRGHLAGIDFGKPVEEVEFEEGKGVEQHQIKQEWQGSYYAEPGTEATRLGISSEGMLNGVVVKKGTFPYTIAKNTTVLRTTAAPILDTWSNPENHVQTEGGGTQYFHPDRARFQPKS